MAHSITRDNIILERQDGVSVQDGTATEFMDLFLANQSAIYAFLRSLLPYNTEPEDIFQQVALTLWSKRESYNPEFGDFRAWAIGIAKNHVRNFNRQQSRQRRMFIFSPDILERVSDGWQRLDDEWGNRQSALAACIQKLSAPDRQVLHRYYSESVSPQGLAEEEGMPLRSWYRKIQRLRKVLLECISKTLTADERVHGRP